MGLTFDALLYFKFMGTLVISWCLVQDQQQVYTYHRFTSHELSEWHTEVHLKRVLSTKENRYRKVQLVIPALLQSRTKLLGSFPIMSTFLCSKTISKTSHLCEKKTPFLRSMLLATNAQWSGFLLTTQQHCFQEKGKREEPVQLRCVEKCCPSIQFSQQFCPRL